MVAFAKAEKKYIYVMYFALFCLTRKSTQPKGSSSPVSQALEELFDFLICP